MDIVTIADAIAVLDYLHKREILCQHCGTKLAKYENQWHHRCEDCVSKNARYTPYKVPNELERRICDALIRWNAANPPDEGGLHVGDLAGLQGDK